MENSQAGENSETFADLLSQHDAGMNNIQTGQKIEGKVIAFSGDDIFIDVGLKEDGVMDIKEILDADGNPTLRLGDSVSGFVTGITSQGVRLSRSMGGSGVAALEEAKEAGLPVEGRVKGPCKGGYQIETMGKTAFCPGSQMEQGEPEELTGKQMRFLITKIENHGRNIVVSRRALLDREKQESLDKLLEEIKIGDTVEGRVTRLAPFGAFIELAPGVEGMAHISELAWSRIGNADEALSVDDMVRVKILDITRDDKGRARISLSRKQAMGDPWQNVEGRFHPGDIAQGKVRRFAPFGAFVEIAPGIEGLIHLSEMSWAKRVNNPEEVLTPGELVEVKVKEVDPAHRRISLSLRDALGDPWENIDQKFAPGQEVTGVIESRSPYGYFVSLAPGITGLLPSGTIKNAPAFAKLEPGANVALMVQAVDPAARRISLTPPSAEQPVEDKTWRDHTKTTPSEAGDNLMTQALKKAMQKKQGEKNA